jgi:hypothetical protein
MSFLCRKRALVLLGHWSVLLLGGKLRGRGSGRKPRPGPPACDMLSHRRKLGNEKAHAPGAPEAVAGVRQGRAALFRLVEVSAMLGPASSPHQAFAPSAPARPNHSPRATNGPFRPRLRTGFPRPYRRISPAPAPIRPALGDDCAVLACPRPWSCPRICSWKHTLRRSTSAPGAIAGRPWP